MMCCKAIVLDIAAEGLPAINWATLFGRWRAARAGRPVRAYGLAGRRRQWALTWTFSGLEADCLRSSAGASAVGCSSLSSIRTRPDLASEVKIIRIITFVLDIRVQWAGSKVLAHLYKKIQSTASPEEILCNGFSMPNLRRLSLNASRIILAQMYKLFFINTSFTRNIFKTV